MGGFRTRNLYFFLSAVFFLLASLLPATALGHRPTGSPMTQSATQSKLPLSADGFTVKLTATDKTVRLSRSEYLFGVVAAEMGGGFEPEALKAQAVAAYSFALYRSAENGSKPYDLTDDPSIDQGYLSREEAKAKWGERFSDYEKAIDDAIASVDGYKLVDDDSKPILAAYHAVSCGRTESAAVAWGQDIGYLQPVESVGDLLSPNYLSQRSFTAAELAEKLAPAVSLTGDKAGWLGKVTLSESGTVTEIVLGGKSLSGEQVRSLLGLRSAAFEIAPSDDGFIFNVKGYGHGVGMSQYGANYMAKCGSTFLEILSHYYTGCKMIRA